jgi:CRP-like cAMP-binding protein
MTATLNGKAVTNQEKALRLSITGMTNKEIGEQLGVSEPTASRWVNEQRAVELEELARALKASQAAFSEMKAESASVQAAFIAAKADAEQAKEALALAKEQADKMKAAINAAKVDAEQAKEALALAKERAGETKALQAQYESACTELATLRQELASLQQTKQHLANAQQQLQQMREADAARKRAWLINIFQGQNFMSLIVLVGGISLAVSITAPIFISVGVPEIPAYAMSIYVDIACFIFVLNNRHRLGIGFSIATAVQAIIKLGGLNWMEPAGLVIVKAAVLAVALGLATYGFSDLIASKKSTH